MIDQQQSDADAKDDKKQEPTAPPAPNEPEVIHEDTGSKYERTFITFENERLFREAFKRTARPRPPLKSLCAITR